MTSKNVTNNSKSPLGLPNGQIIDPKSTVLVKGWEKVESNEVVKGWVAAEALTLADAPESDDDTGPDTTNAPVVQTNEGGNGGPVVLFVPKTADELKPMTNAELAAHIEKDLGGEVKSGSTKDDLLKQIGELSAAKVAANAAATQTN